MMKQTLLKLMLALACSLTTGATQAMGDQLDRPALLSPRASHGLLLAVTRAGTRLVAVGERGIVLLSDDSGRSWRQARVPVSVSLTNVRFVDARTGWATGHSGVLLHSADGGETWSRKLDGRRVAQIIQEAEAGADADPAMRAEAQRLVHDGPDKPLLDVAFVTANTGFVVGAYGIILRSDDGGGTWQAWHRHLASRQGRHFYGISFAGPQITLVGEQGTAFQSTDGGKHFRELVSPYRGSFFGLVAAPDGGRIIYGLRGHAFHLDERGGKWTAIATQVPDSIAAGLMTSNGKVLLASQAGRLLASSDAGRSFRPLPAREGFLVTGLAEAPDGSIVASGSGGILRLASADIEGNRR